MTSKLTYLGAIGLAATSIVAAGPAYAAGTAAGASITNTATVDYQVGGVSQGQQSASNTFVVDRMINLTVIDLDGATTNVVPGQANAVTTFRLTNNSNETLDFALAATQPVGGAGAHSGPADNFDLPALSIYRDTNGNNTYDAGTDVLVTYADELAADSSVVLFVVGNIPASRVNGDRAVVQLRATAREGGASGSLGAAITQTTGANTAAKDTVFADTAGANDAARDGAHSAADDFTVQTATLAVAKSSRVISDPINGTTNPKLIPGAVVEYCIAVGNSGGAPATSVVINDPVPAQLTFNAGTILLGGTYTGTVPSGTCDFNGTAGGSYTGTTVSGTIASIAAGASSTLVFRATVN
jgi:uncharacterized repeat protein (TIGR01451 family)